MNYIKAHAHIKNAPSNGIVDASCKIRGRGNYTWDNYPKKPYKLKFETKQSIFDFPANKDWMLLAEYADRSLLRIAYMCEVSLAVGKEWTPRYKHVDLVLNGDSLGTYTLIEQVEKAKGKIDITKEGFIIECDNYYYEEPLFFKSTISTPHPRQSFNSFKYFTFKYPDADDKEIVEGDGNYKYIQDFMSNLESSILILENDPLNKDYLKYIDIQSFAKWFIVVQLTANYDPNFYFVLPSKHEKLKMYPVWDAEWSLGAWSYLWGEKPSSLLEDNLAERTLYFHWLIKSPTFIDELKKEWASTKSAIYGVTDQVREVYDNLYYSQAANYKRWKYEEGAPYWHAATWEEEASYVFTFFLKRLKWMDDYIEKVSCQNL